MAVFQIKIHDSLLDSFRQRAQQDGLSVGAAIKSCMIERLNSPVLPYCHTTNGVTPSGYYPLARRS